MQPSWWRLSAPCCTKGQNVTGLAARRIDGPSETWLKPSGVRRLQIHLTTGNGGSVGQGAMVDGKQGQFQAIRNPGFVIDIAQVIFDDLFGGAEVAGNFLIFEPLNNERDDLDFFGGEAIAHAGADGIGFLGNATAKFFL